MPKPKTPEFDFDIPTDAAPDTGDNGNMSYPMPDEFLADEPQSDFDLDSLGFDDSRDEADRRKMQAPAGDWMKSEVWSFEREKNIRVNPEDRQQGDVNSGGRTSYTLYGYPDTRTSRDGDEFKPFLRIYMSPDRRMHREKAGQFDHAYKMFLKAKDLFIGLYDRKPTSHGELLKCLVEDTYVVNTMNGDDGPFVLGLKAPRRQR